MSIEFNGTSQYLSLSGSSVSTAFTGYPFSMSCWAYFDTTTKTDYALSLGDDTSTNKIAGLRNRGNITLSFSEFFIWNNTNVAPARNYVTGDTSTGFTIKALDTDVTATTWYLMVGVARSDSIVEFYMSRDPCIWAGRASNAAVAYFSPNAIYVGASALSGISYGDGRVAHVGLWNNYGLTYADIGRLKNGALPSAVAVSNLFDYWALSGTDGETAGSQTGLKSNVLTATGSPVYRPQPTISGITSNCSIGKPLRDASGTLLTSQSGLKGRLSSTALPSTGAIDWQGTFDTNASGLITNASPALSTSLSNGATAWFEASNSAGVAYQTGKKTFAGPVVVTHV